MNSFQIAALCLMSIVGLLVGLALALPGYKKVTVPWKHLLRFVAIVYPFIAAFAVAGSPHMSSNVIDAAGTVVAFAIGIGFFSVFSFLFWHVVLWLLDGLTNLWNELPEHAPKKESCS